MTKTYDVVGIGNALVDVIAHAEDAFLEEMGVERGIMTLIGTDRARALYDAMGPGREVSGGQPRTPSRASPRSARGRPMSARSRTTSSARSSPTI
jgi:sugar/nucleoside kinase (ribokinase family)